MKKMGMMGKIITAAVLGIGGLCMFFFVLVLSISTDETGDIAEVQTTTSVEEVVAPTEEVIVPTEVSVTNTPAIVEALNEKDQLRFDLEKSLGENNRGINTITSVEIETVAYTVDEPTLEISIVWTINDNFTGNMIRRGIMMDIADILKVISESGIAYETVFLTGTFPLVDALGNITESNVVMVWYGDIIEEINWDGFLTDNVYVIADDFWMHPAMKE